ncbi:MAG: response regulator [Planctomycetes bacterium]|nr:response regulator [Planctomycetota bacterium]
MPGKPKILIVDDDDDYRASTRDLLEGEGYQVVEAASGAEALQVVRSERPNLIVLDIMMEYQAAGYSINQALKLSEEYRDLRDTPIIMVSSVETDPASLFGWIGDTSPITPDAYLTKPLDIAEFLRRIRSLLEQRDE